MKAYLHSVRIAPKKANLIAHLVRGLSVREAITSLQHTHKKGARIVEKLIKSAVANAEHNDKQDASLLVIKTIVVNQAQAYKRGVPKARGQVRPVSRFMSHIEVTLGIAEHDEGEKKPAKTAKKTTTSASQKKENAVKKSSSKKNADSSPSPSESSDRSGGSESSDSSSSPASPQA